MIKNIFVKILLVLILAFLANGCRTYVDPLATEPATLGTNTKISKELKSIPPPKEKIVTAVYKFRDQTGQYKPTQTGTSWSTAVTQGATSILIRALEESGWFLPIEREGLSDLLNERKIIRSSRATYQGENENGKPLLPPLLFAGVILEGGIISYDTNVLTGGAGIKYFGAGASGQYRQDRVTVYLRAISTTNGKILKTVYTTKTILSQAVDVGFFRFVDFKRLLEVETGYSYNEPLEMCVTEAIEKAVYSLILEGTMDGLWQFEHPEDMNSKVVKNYLTEKEESKTIDYFGYRVLKPRTLGIGINSGAQQYQGDLANGQTKPLIELYLTNPVSSSFDLGLRFGGLRLKAEKFFESLVTYAGAFGKYYMLPTTRFTPYVQGGVDVAHLKSEDRFGNEINIDSNWSVNLAIGLGFEYRFWDKVGLNFLFDYNYMLTDGLDGVRSGKYNDYFWAGRIGFSFYPGL